MHPLNKKALPLLLYFFLLGAFVTSLPLPASAWNDIEIRGSWDAWADPTTPPKTLTQQSDLNWWTVIQSPADIAAGTSHTWKFNMQSGVTWRGNGEAWGTIGQGTAEQSKVITVDGTNMTIQFDAGYYHIYNDNADNYKIEPGRVRTDGVVYNAGTTESVKEWPANTLMDTSNNIQFYMNYDTNFLYFGIKGVNLTGANGDFFVAIDTDGWDTGFFEGPIWDNRRHRLPIRADAMLSIEDGTYQVLANKRGSVDWSDPGNGNNFGTAGGYFTADGTTASGMSEYRIAWGALGGLPDTMRILAWYQPINTNNNAVSASWPTQNPARNADTEQFTHYYEWNQMSTKTLTSSQNPKADSHIYAGYRVNALVETSAGRVFYLNWDTYRLYIGFDSCDLASASGGDFFVYIDTNGTTSGVQQTAIWDNRRHFLPIYADACLTVDASTYKEVRVQSGSNFPMVSDGSGFGRNTAGTGGFFNVASTRSDFGISWGALGGKPDTMRVIAFYQPNDANNNAVVAAWPQQNPVNMTDTQSFTRYYYFTQIKNAPTPMTDSRIVQNQRVHINDINYNSYPCGIYSDSDDYMELYNSSGVQRNIGGFTLRDMESGDSLVIPSGTLLDTGARVVVHTCSGPQGYKDQNGTLHYFGGQKGGSSNWFNNGNAYDGAVGLYATNTLDSAGLMDFVMWTNSASFATTIDDTAVFDGIWNNNASVRIVSTRVDNAIIRTIDGSDTQSGDTDDVSCYRAVTSNDGSSNEGVTQNPSNAFTIGGAIGFYQSDYSTAISNPLPGDTVYVKWTTAGTAPNASIKDICLAKIWTSSSETIILTLTEDAINSKVCKGWFVLARDSSLSGAERLKVYYGDTLYADTYTSYLSVATADQIRVFDTATNPNNWYLNDGSTAGDSFTSAVGNDANDGLSPATPRATLGQVLPFMSPGDTLYIDSGSFNYAAQIILDDTGCFYIGVDSSGSIINFTAAADILISTVDSITFRNVQIKAPQNGFNVNDADFFTADRVQVVNPTQSGILLTAPANAYSNKATIETCYIRGATQSGIVLTSSTGCNVFDNWVYKPANHGILLNSRSDSNLIMKNRAELASNHGITLDNCLWNRIDSNTIYSNQQMGLILSNTSSNSTIRWNTIDSNVQSGIQISTSSASETILSNAIKRNQQYGIDISLNAGTSLVVQGNAITSNLQYGVSNNAISGTVFRNNLFGNNVWQGLYLIGASTNCLVQANDFDSNGNPAQKYSLQIDATATGCLVNKNSFVARPNDTSLVYVDPANMDLKRNYWGTTDTNNIRSRILGGALGTAVYFPYRLSAIDTTIGGDTVAPTTPDTVSAVGYSLSEIQVTWKPVLTDEEADPFDTRVTKYKIYRSNASDSYHWDLRGAADSPTLSFIDSGCNTTDTYFYKVTTIDDNSVRANEASFGDTYASSKTLDLSTIPNAWYVNDATYDGNDSFCGAIGSNSNSGSSRTTPFLRVDSAFAQLSAGDTIYIDAGTFTPTDTLRIKVGPVWIIGVDSSKTIINFGDSTQATYRALFCTYTFQPTIRNLWVKNAYNGIYIYNTDSAEIVGVRSSTNNIGFNFESGSDSGTAVTCRSDSNASYGYYFGAATQYTVNNCLSESNGSSGYYFNASADSNRLTTCAAYVNHFDGFHVVSTSDSNTFTSCQAVANIAGAGFAMNGGRDNTFRQCASKSNSNQGYYIAANNNNYVLDTASGNTVGYYLSYVSGVWVYGCTTSQSGSYGIQLDGSSKDTVTLCRSETSAGHGIWINNNSDSNLISYSTSVGNTSSGDGFQTAVGSDSNIFLGNASRGNAGAGFAMQDTGNYNTLRDNLSYGNTAQSYWNATNYTFYVNDTSQGGTSGITFNFAGYGVIDGCTLTGSTGYGIELNGSSWNTVRNCVITSHSSDGIRIGNQTQGCTVAYNGVRGNGDVGIRVYDNGDNNYLVGNTVETNVTDGILLQGAGQGTTDSCHVRANVIRANKVSGLKLLSATGCLLEDNESDSSGDYCLFMDAPSTGNTIRQNTFNPKAGDTTVATINNANQTIMRNYWGSTDSNQVRGRFIGSAAATAVYTPWRLGPIDTSTYGTDTVAPKAPDTVAAAARTASTITVSWAPVTADEEADSNAVNLNGYSVWRATSSTASNWTRVGRVGSSTTQLDDSNLTSSTTYYYRVTAYDNISPYFNESFWSDSIIGETTFIRTNSWHIISNNEPDTGGGDADSYMRTTTRDGKDTMWPRRRTKDNPIILWLGKFPTADTPTAVLYYETVGSTAWVAVNYSETTVITTPPNTYFRFLLNQENNSKWDRGDTIQYYFRLTGARNDTTFVFGSGNVDDVTTSDSQQSETTAQSKPFIYAIRSTAPDSSVAVNPLSGTNVYNRRPTITWNAANDVDTPTGDQVVDYFFDISPNSDMTSHISSEIGWKGNVTNYTIANNLTIGQTYYWRMNAKDSYGFVSDSSSIFSFTVQKGARAIDGDTTDWTQDYPTSADTSLIKDSEYIWKASIGDQRTDFPLSQNQDMSLFRVTADQSNIYFLWAAQDITSTDSPMVAIEIDTDLAYKSGGTDMGGFCRTVASDSARGEIHMLANITRTGYWPTNFSAFVTAGASWMEAADTSNSVEMSMPWSNIGLSLPTTVRLTVIDGNANGTDFRNSSGWDPVTMSRSLDGITTGPRKASQSGNWYGEVTTPDTTAGYYFDVDFDTYGKVVPNKLVVTTPAERVKTFDTFVLTIRAADFNGNACPQFAESVSFSSNGAGTLTVVDTTAWVNGIMTATLYYSRQETITITVKEMKNGKIGTCTMPVRAVPVVRIGEVGVAYSTPDNSQSDSDFIELFVANDHNDRQGVNLQNWRIYTTTTGSPQLRKTLGTMNVKESSFVTLFFASAQADSTSDAADSRANVYTTASNSSMPTTEGLIQLVTDVSSETIDAVPYTDHGAVNAAISSQLQLLVDTGLWSPDNDTDNMVYSTLTGTKGYALRRDGAFKDSNVMGDWTADTQTPGNYPGSYYIINTDSTNPSANSSLDTFNLRIYAMDGRNDTIVSARFQPSLTISNGIITPTRVKYTSDTVNYFNLGDTRCSSAITNTQGAQTLTVQSGSMTGTLNVTVMGVTESFALWAPQEVKRTDSFSLRVRASDRTGTTISTFTGTVALAINNYNIVPSQIIFTSADAGDTTIKCQIGGANSAGVLTITGTWSGITGSCTTTPLTDTSIVISEFLPNDTDRYRVSGQTGRDRDEWVEFFNRGAASVNMNGWRFRTLTKSGTEHIYGFPSVSVPQGKWVVVHFNKQGTDDLNFNDTDGAAHLYSFNSAVAMSDSEDIIAHSSVPFGLFLYTSSTFDSSTIVDYIGFDQGSDTNAALPDTDAGNAGIWTRGLTLNLPSTAANEMGRTFYRISERVDSNGTGSAEWSTIASDGSTDSYRFTEGCTNVTTQPSSTSISLTTTTSPSNGANVAAGDTIYITLTGTDGDANAVNSTTVFVYSDTDPEGIVVTLFETGKNTGVFKGEAYAAKSPLESNDGMRIIVGQPGDSLYVRWAGGGSDKQSKFTAGPLDHFYVSPSATVIQSGEQITLTVRAQDAGNYTVTTFTGAVRLTTSDSRPYPETVTILSSGNGESTITITLGSDSGNITITATASSKTGTTVVTVVKDTGLVINEVLANVGTIDWDASGAANEDADEWFELYNKSTTAIDLTGMKLTHSASSSQITLADSIPGKGYVTIYRGGAGTGKSYHFDSMGVLIDTRLNLTGSFSTGTPNGGGTVYILSPAGDTIAILAYPSVLDDSSYGRTPDGVSQYLTFKHATNGVSPTASPNNDSSPNAKFRLDAPVNVQLNTAFTLNAFLATSNGDTVTTFNDTATLYSKNPSSVVSPTSVTFTNGVVSVSVTFTNGNVNESSSLYIQRYGGIQGGATLSIVQSSVSTETSKVSVEQGIADGMDTAMIQVVVLNSSGGPVSGVVVSCTSSKGVKDTITPSSYTTAADGVCSFTVTSRDTAQSKITVVANSNTLLDSPYMYWLDPVESGVSTSFGTKTTLLTIDDDSHFILFPVWRSDGKALAYLAKTASVDTWCIYVVYDDGAHGDGSANDGTFSNPIQVTGTQHGVFCGSRPCFSDILDAGGARVALGASGDGVPDIVYSAFNGNNRKDLYAVRSDGSDSAKAKASTVILTDNSGSWTSPTSTADTDAMYAIFQGSMYRIYGKGTSLWGSWASGGKILEGGTTADFMIAGNPYSIVDIAPYDKNKCAVTFVLNKIGDPLKNKRSYIGTIVGLDTASFRQWTDTNAVKLVNRPDSMIAWNLSWDTGGKALSWARDINGNFNWLNLWTRHAAPEAAYIGTNFDVEVIYVTDTGSTPNHPAPLINNVANFNDNSANFSPGSKARVSYVTYDTTTGGGVVKLNILDIDGVTTVNQSGGLLFENGRLTAVIDESNVLAGSVQLKVAKPTSTPANSTPESLTLTGKAREFFPNGQTFNDSITVILYYEDAELAAAGITNGTAAEYTLRVYWYNPGASRWEDYGAIVDPTDRNGARGTLTFQTNHFSTYGVGFSTRNKPNAPTPIAPLQGATLTTPSQNFTWIPNDTSARPQTAFRLQVSRDTGFETNVADVVNNQSETTTVVALPLGDNALWWRVQTAADGRAFGDWCAPVSFTAAIHVPDTPELLTPQSGAETTNTRPVFSWRHIDRDSDPQARYQFTIATDTAFVNELYSIAVDSNASVAQVPGDLSVGAYFWRVRTADLLGFGAWAAARSLTIATPPGQAPTPLPVSEPVTSVSPTFRWIHQNASNLPQTAYQLEISGDSSFASPQVVIAAAGTDSSVTLSGDNALALRGSMRLWWRIRTATSGMNFGPAADSSFLAALNAPNAPTLLTPEDGVETTASSFTFSWTHNDSELDAQTGYGLRIARDTSFANPIFSEAIASSASSRTLAMSLSGGTYWWKLATRDGVDLGAFSAPRRFSVDTRALAPLLTSPAPGATLTAPSVSFAWTHRDPNNAPQSAALVEIARDSAFASLWRSRVVSGSAQTATFDGADSLFILGESTVYWRVRTASFGTDYGPVSSSSSFVIHTALPQPPRLLAPADRYLTRSPELDFQWSHRDSMPQERFELQVSPDTSFASPLVIRGFSEEDALFAPADFGTRYWRVRTSNMLGWGSFSEARSFNHPFWRSAVRVSEPRVPVGETVAFQVELLTETGVPTEWVPGIVFTIGSKTLRSRDFIADSAYGSIAVAFETAGVYLIRAAQEDVSSARDTLYVLARSNTTDTYMIVSGRNGIGQRVMDDDTALSVMLHLPNADSALRLRIATLCETTLFPSTAPTSFDTRFARWENVPVALSGGGRICLWVLRGSDTVASDQALVFARPTRAVRFVESETSAKPIVIEVPAGATDTPLFITFRRGVAENTTDAATRAARTSGRKLVDSSVVEIVAEDIDGHSIENFAKGLTLHFPSTGGNKLRIVFLRNGEWVDLTGSAFDSAAQEATASTDHLTVWGLTVAAVGSGSVQSTVIYPNPWRSDGPTAGLSTANAAFGLKFDQLPSSLVRIRVYTIAGELVVDGSLDPSSLGATTASGHLQVVDVGGATGQITRWDLKNQNGREVASGVYIIVIDGPGGTATRKFAVIR